MTTAIDKVITTADTGPSNTAVAPLDILGWGVVSPAGMGLDPLRAALLADAPVGVGPERAGVAAPEAFPPGRLRAVADLDVTGRLGKRKGLRTVDRTAALGLVATKLALDSATDSPVEDGAPGAGLVLGTSLGGLRSITEFGRETWVRELPYLVDPGVFPNTMLNYAAGQIAIHNALTGVNATVPGGAMASLLAIRYARVAIGRGRATRLLVGGVEELSPQLAWGWRRSGAISPRTTIGEGAALFVLEPASSANRAQLLACEVGFCAPEIDAETRARLLARCVRRALARSGVSTGEVGVVAPGATGQLGLAPVERAGLDLVLAGEPVDRIDLTATIGETYAAGGALQLAGLLAHWTDAPAGTRPIGLVTSVDRDGGFGCLVVRKGD